jgi:hypothetical protein
MPGSESDGTGSDLGKTEYSSEKSHSQNAWTGNNGFLMSNIRLSN